MDTISKEVIEFASRIPKNSNQSIQFVYGQETYSIDRNTGIVTMLKKPAPYIIPKRSSIPQSVQKINPSNGPTYWDIKESEKYKKKRIKK